MIAIAGVGLVTSHGDAVAIPWPLREHAVSRAYRPCAVDAPPGPARLEAMIARALADAGARGPVLVASCNGGNATWDDDAWRASFDLGRGPVVSAACASGIHALYLARAMIAAGAPDVTVVAADLVTPPSHDNFEALRVLSDAPAPYQADAAGFQLGEAAVAIRLTSDPVELPILIGPVLGHDLDGDDGLVRCLAALGDPIVADLVIGQGTGPAAVDAAELAAIARFVAPDVPLATALAAFGHTHGASSLLSVALAAFAPAAGARFDALASRHATAVDGRPLGAGLAHRVAVACRALGGACGACMVIARHDELPAVALARAWGPRATPPPLRDPVLRRIATEADPRRPAAPPDLLVVTLDAPLPPAGRIGGRILPTSVLEMTPGFIPQLVARAWGYRGPAVCLVGGDPQPILAACRATHDRVCHLAIRGMHDRDVEWTSRG